MGLRDSSLKLQGFLLGPAEGSRIAAIVRLIVLVVLLLVAAWAVYFGIVAVSSPYPLEFREGAPLVMTRLLLEGQNPFSLANQPLGTNNYGIVFSLSVVPFAAAFGNTLIVHRLVSVIFILLCSWLIYGAALRASADRLLAALCALMIAVALAAQAGLGAFPASMGMFFFLAALLVPLNRGFDDRSLILSVFLCLLAFYTKPYFLLSFGIVATYVFLFVSKGRALFYAVLFGTLFVLSAVLVKTVLPLYFFDTVVSNWAQAVITSPDQLYEHLTELGNEFYPILIAAVVILLVAGPRVWLGGGTGKAPISRPDLLSPARPVFSWSPDLFAYSFLCGLLVFVFVLGLHTLNTMNTLSYAYQLLLAPLLLWLAAVVKPRTWLGVILMPLLLWNLASFTLYRLSPSMLVALRDEAGTWERLYQVVDNSKHILNSPLIVPEMIRLGMWPVDSGQTEYYFWYSDYRRMEWLGPSYIAVRNGGQRYLDSIRAAVADQEFDSIIVTEHWGLPHAPGLTIQNYQITATITVDMPLTDQHWNVDIWKPIANSGTPTPTP